MPPKGPHQWKCGLNQKKNSNAHKFISVCILKSVDTCVEDDLSGIL